MFNKLGHLYQAPIFGPKFWLLQGLNKHIGHFFPQGLFNKHMGHLQLTSQIFHSPRCVSNIRGLVRHPAINTSHPQLWAPRHSEAAKWSWWIRAPSVEATAPRPPVASTEQRPRPRRPRRCDGWMVGWVASPFYRLKDGLNREKSRYNWGMVWNKNTGFCG